MITDDIKLIKKFSEKLFHFYDERDEIEDYNVKIIIGQDYNKKTFKAHLYLIRAMCPYFNTAFKKDWRKKDNDGFFFIEKPNIKPEVFEVILRCVWPKSLFMFPFFAIDNLILHISIFLTDIFIPDQFHVKKNHPSFYSKLCLHLMS